MSPWQFWTLNILSVVLATLILTQYFLVQDVQKRSQLIQAGQQQINTAQQAEQVLKVAAIRVAQAAEKEPELKNLLKKYSLNVNLTEGAPAAGQ
jgi:hypothetical protein